MLGCTNPLAVNYNAAATEEDYSCIYLERLNGICFAFQDVDPDEVEDKSFTLSWSLEKKNWVYFHGYFPDFYVHTRDKLLNIKGRNVYLHKGGQYGKYHDTVQPFFIDVVFAGESSMILDAVNWITEVLNADGSEQEEMTLTHLTVWNRSQCTGRKELPEVFTNLVSDELRRTKKQWSFNDLRDMLTSHGTQFLSSIFDDFRPTGTSSTKPWFELERLEDNYFVVRFEFDNTANKQITIQDINAQVTPSNR